MRLDACPNCLQHDNPPRRQTTTPDGTRAAYRCTRCHHTWTTDWTNPSSTTRNDDWEPHAAFD